MYGTILFVLLLIVSLLYALVHSPDSREKQLEDEEQLLAIKRCRWNKNDKTR